MWNENIALSLLFSFFDTFHFPLFPSRPWQRIERIALSGIFHPNRILLQSATARHRFSALWLRSKLVTVLIELTFDISSIEESKVVWFLEAWSEPGLAPTDHGSFQRGTRAGHGPHPEGGGIIESRKKKSNTASRSGSEILGSRPLDMTNFMQTVRKPTKERNSIWFTRTHYLTSCYFDKKIQKCKFVMSQTR